MLAYAVAGPATAELAASACFRSASSSAIFAAAPASGMLCGLAAGAPFDLQLSVGQAASADHHAQRNADQVGILELDAGALIAIVQQHVDAGGRQFLVELVGNVGDLGLFHVERDQQHFVGSQRQRPDDAVFVVAGFDQRGDDPIHADAVAAHDQGVLLFVGVEIFGLQGGGVFGAELEDVADFDRLLQFELGGAARTRIAGAGVAQIGKAVRRRSESRDPGSRRHNACRPRWRR